ncbi:host attachment protein [Solimonas sp. SE-A11]|uniref:host attachment protein n=1 Tax=Solimonas sp. SE-A11 TaxID=3054954 RepID=UPI00259CE716|nr:host attachment protein [Solimonas sp. SE-A11]MDM4771246.1 host attachment protein [Solimonas sp. SE-A11]
MNAPNRRSGPSLVVALDAARARILAALTPEAPLRDYASLANPEGRLHEGDLVADSGGCRNHRPTEGGHSASGGGSMKQHRTEEFAASVCEGVEAALRDTHAERLYVVAEPGFLGLLRQRMDDQVEQRVVGTIPKSLANETPERIRAALPSRL